MKKKIVFITQAKGGSGKSVLAFMLAEKYNQATILDLDDATTTTMTQLAYRKPLMVSFLDQESRRIDRGAFNGLFESVVAANRELFIADLGASVAEQLPKYFEVNGIEVIADMLVSNNIHLRLICVVGGGNIFKATMEYLSELVQSVSSQIEIIVAFNGYYPLSAEQKNVLLAYVNTNNLQLFSFDLVRDKGETAMRTVENVMKDGKGITGINPFHLVYFKKGMESLNIDLCQ